MYVCMYLACWYILLAGKKIEMVYDVCMYVLTLQESSYYRSRIEHEWRADESDHQFRRTWHRRAVRQISSRWKGATILCITCTYIHTFIHCILLTFFSCKCDRAAQELLLEKGRRLEAEAYMQQVLRDVERKAPIIASQKRDYMRSFTHSQRTLVHIQA